VVGEPESVESARAAAAFAPSPVESVEVVVPVVVPLGAVVVVLPGAEVDGLAPGLVTEPAAEVGPGFAPAELLELLGRGGVVLAGFGLGAGGRLDDEDGLGDGDGLGAALAGGGLLGAPPEPNANPMTLPGAGS